MNYQAAKSFIINKLQTELASNLYYHGLHHTLDVLQVAGDLCVAQQCTAYETTLVKTAALFHDSGFTISSQEHEKLGCDIVRKYLPDFGYSTQEIATICGMIMATKIPQSPNSHLEEILCDADLDYLGRSDFYSIGATLFRELQAFDLVQKEEEWNKIQVSFLESHAFFTTTNKQRRAPQKQRHLDELRGLIYS